MQIKNKRKKIKRFQAFLFFGVCLYQTVCISSTHTNRSSFYHSVNFASSSHVYTIRPSDFCMVWCSYGCIVSWLRCFAAVSCSCSQQNSESYIETKKSTQITWNEDDTPDRKCLMIRCYLFIFSFFHFYFFCSVHAALSFPVYVNQSDSLLERHRWVKENQLRKYNAHAWCLLFCCEETCTLSM